MFENLQPGAKRLLTIYATLHSSVFPFLLSKNITMFASGFTQTAFFCFYPTHVLQQNRALLVQNSMIFTQTPNAHTTKLC